MSEGTRLADLALELSVEVDPRLCAAAISRHICGAVASEAWCVDLAPTNSAESRTIVATGVSDYFLNLYERTGRERDPVLAAAVDQGAPFDNRRLMSDDEWQEQPVYRDVFSLHQLAHILYAPILVEGEVIGTLDFGRTLEAGAYSREEMDSAHEIADLVGRALEVGMRNHAARQGHELFRGALDLSEEAVVVTDSTAAERHLNVRARRLLAALAPGVVLDEIVMRSRERPAGSEQKIPLRSGKTARLRARSATISNRPDCIATFLDLDDQGPPSLPPHIESALSRRECDVAALAALGMRDDEIAASLCLSRHTVKQYLKSTYGKLGLRSRVELAAAVAAGSKAR